MIKVGQAGWLEKEKPVAGAFDAIIKPIAVAPCSSDTHAMHGGIGEMNNVILGHEAVGEVAEVGSSVTKFKVGDRVIVPCVTPSWQETALQRRGINNGHDAGLLWVALNI